MHPCLVSIPFLFLCFLNASTFVLASIPTHFTGDVTINCGSIGTFTASNGREWIGDEKPKFSSLLQIEGSSTTSTVIHKLISADPVPHKTARISLSHFSYTFQLSPGQKILRLHFYPAPYKGFKRFKDLFTVEAGVFTLISNFSASLTAAALGVKSFSKEFCLSIEEHQTLDITFSPASSQVQDSTYAFINGIEIISVPMHLSYFRGGDLGAQVVGQKSLVYIDNSTALELIHRLNVKRDSVSSGDDFDDMLGMWATVPAQNGNEFNNLTWKRSVDVGFRYLVRIHFCELGLKMAETGGMTFKILINQMIVDTNTDIVKERDDNGSLWYRDYMVSMKGRKQEDRRDLLICLQSSDEFMDGHRLLKGFEIFKLSNPDNSLASPNALPPARDSPSWIIQNFVSGLGNRNAIATASITVIAVINIIVYKLRIIWEATFTEEENRPSARAERVCRRFSLAEIKSATRNFSDAFVIGKGGFGKVYKGHIDNGRETVAIKRLKSNSKQGKHEFLTEIETLSELRHINLVSLIGYCSERREMILVYEFMACGTLADHLYKLAKDNNNCSSITWKQRLNICIGAARGLDYLHTGHRVIHRDVKTSNILLDENFVAKVSDFGLAKPEDRSKLQSHIGTKIKGTFGYFDPYYFSTHKLTRKSDTYAFGVVLLEVLSGDQQWIRHLGRMSVV
ncbi:UNVERIFIED_CONTAM: Receptor-like protein kinase FERONIA [Sesamum angustifolium]|uniref:Receptor-like protein kinase FERONIA n=1 Tax=Sesamum angustifolium TaxID=2727405 RepID=A0AAW2NL95_9LAMI